MNNYFELNFEVIKKIDKSRHGGCSDIRLVNLGRIALIKICKLTASSSKHLEDISHAHIVSLMLKPKTSSKDSDDLSIEFDRDRKIDETN